MNVTATTLPRKFASEICAPSCEINVNPGAGAIFGSDEVSNAAGAASGDGSINLIAAGGTDARVKNARISGARMVSP
jgi:hypothetical protein